MCTRVCACVCVRARSRERMCVYARIHTQRRACRTHTHTHTRKTTVIKSCAAASNTDTGKDNIHTHTHTHTRGTSEMVGILLSNRLTLRTRERTSSMTPHTKHSIISKHITVTKSCAVASDMDTHTHTHTHTNTHSRIEGCGNYRDKVLRSSLRHGRHLVEQQIHQIPRRRATFASENFTKVSTIIN